jgi:Alginate export
MKKLLQIGFFIILFGTFQNDLFSQFELSGELRPRLEIRDGYRKLAPDSSSTAVFVSQRNRFKLSFTNNRFKVFLSLQDIRVWGNEGQLRNIPSQVMHEGWAQLKFNKNLDLKVGRQEIIFDEHRLLGNVNWAQQARSHDAAVLQYHKDSWKIDFATAYNNERELVFNTRYELVNYRALSYLYVNKKIKDKFTISLMGISDGVQSLDTLANKLNFRFTTGTYMKYKTNGLTLNGEFYYQLGKWVTRRSINAYMFAFSAFYNVKSFTIGAGVDFISGTDALDQTNTKNNSFNTLYATNHKFYGYMDYFLNIPVDTKGGGLIDGYLKTKVKTSDKTALMLDLHNFSLANNVASPTDSSIAITRGLGTEIDFVFNYNIDTWVNLKVGYSTMFASSSMEVLTGGNRNNYQQWGWVMLTIKPEFFNSEKFMKKINEQKEMN